MIVVTNKHRHVGTCTKVPEGSKPVPNTKLVRAATERADCECWVEYEKEQAALEAKRAARKAAAAKA